MKIAFEEAIDSRNWIVQEIEHGEGLADLLRQYAETPETAKKNLTLFSGAIFNHNETKLQSEIKEIHALILDFDGCSRPWQEVSKIFEPYEHIVYSSWSNGIKSPGHRFRIVIPFSEPLINISGMSAASQYHHLWDYLTFGYFDDDAVYNIDRGKRSAQSWFYVPARTEHNIWHYHNAPTMNPNAVIHEPDSIALAKARKEIIEQEAAELAARIPAQPTTLSDAEIEKRAEKALSKWASASEGNHNFFKYAKSLKGHGLPLDIIEQLMKFNAIHFGTHTNDRLNDIPRIIKSL